MAALLVINWAGGREVAAPLPSLGEGVGQGSSGVMPAAHGALSSELKLKAHPAGVVQAEQSVRATFSYEDSLV